MTNSKTTSCMESCGPSDFYPGGKCGKNGCCPKPRYRIFWSTCGNNFALVENTDRLMPKRIDYVTLIYGRSDSLMWEARRVEVGGVWWFPLILEKG